MRVTLVTAPTNEPLTLFEAKLHLRVTHDVDDVYIDSLIPRAREAFERETGRQLLTATYKGFLDRFPEFDHEPIEFANPPLLTVASVQYIDTSGALQTWAASEYVVQVYAGPFAQRGQLYPAAEKQYPDTRRIPNAVTLNFDAGYGAAAAVPGEIKQALLAWIGHRFEHRETVVVGDTPAVVPGLGFEPWKEWTFA